MAIPEPTEPPVLFYQPRAAVESKLHLSLNPDRPVSNADRLSAEHGTSGRVAHHEVGTGEPVFAAPVSTAAPTGLQSLAPASRIVNGPDNKQKKEVVTGDSAFSRQLRRLDLVHEAREHGREAYARHDPPMPHSIGEPLIKKRPAGSDAHRSERNFALAQTKRTAGFLPLSAIDLAATADLAPAPVTQSNYAVQRAGAIQQSQPDDLLIPALPSTSSDVDNNVSSSGSANIDDSDGSPRCRGRAQMVREPHVVPITSHQVRDQCEALYLKVTALAEALMTLWARIVKVDSQDFAATPERWRQLTLRTREAMLIFHDFLLITQHPVADEETRALPTKRSILARMWDACIINFLLALRKYPKHAQEFLHDHVYFCMQMILLFYETVPAYALIWAEMMGNIARHKLSVEPHDDMWLWKSISINWYMKASAHAPRLGKQYHNISAMASPNVLAQLFYYSKALVCDIPFTVAHQSISTLFDRVRTVTTVQPPALVAGVTDSDLYFVSLHAVIFQGVGNADLRPQVREYVARLTTRIDSIRGDWRRQGVWIAITNIAAMMQFGAATNPIKRLYDSDQDMVSSDFTPEFRRSCLVPVMELSFSILQMILIRAGPHPGEPIDLDVLAHVHVMLGFFHSLLKRCTHGRSPLGNLIRTAPWTEVSNFLNKLQYIAKKRKVIVKTDAMEDATVALESVTMLPEDLLINGLIWSDVDSAPAIDVRGGDDGVQIFESEAIGRARIARVLELGHATARAFAEQSLPCLSFEPSSRHFSVPCAPAMLFTSKVAADGIQIVDHDMPSRVDLEAL